MFAKKEEVKGEILMENNNQPQVSQHKDIDITTLGDRKVVDLVVPCYKGTPTLLRLLASVASQTMRQNINVIIVQDCDGEDYTELIEMFNKMLSIQLVQMEQNGGPGTCRRVGRKAGKAKYVMYMDADDTFENPFSVQKLYTVIEDSKADAVNSIFLEQVAPNAFLPHDNNDWIWMFGKIYRRRFLEINEIEMNDSRANEDTGFNSIVKCVGEVRYLPDVTYIWHYKEDSITRKDGGIYRFTGIEGWLYNMQWAIDEMIRLNADEENIKQFVADNIMATYIWFLGFLHDEDERVDLEEYKRWVKKYYTNIFEKHVPSEQQLNMSFQMQFMRELMNGRIPKYTFDQYLDMIKEVKE